MSLMPLPYRDVSLGIAVGALLLAPVGLGEGAQALPASLALVPALAALFGLRGAVLRLVGHRAGAAARGPATPCDRRVATQGLALTVAAAAVAVVLDLTF